MANASLTVTMGNNGTLTSATAATGVTISGRGFTFNPTSGAATTYTITLTAGDGVSFLSGSSLALPNVLASNATTVNLSSQQYVMTVYDQGLANDDADIAFPMSVALTVDGVVTTTTFTDPSMLFNPPQ